MLRMLPDCGGLRPEPMLKRCACCKCKIKSWKHRRKKMTSAKVLYKIKHGKLTKGQMQRLRQRYMDSLEYT